MKMGGNIFKSLQSGPPYYSLPKNNDSLKLWTPEQEKTNLSPTHSTATAVSYVQEDAKIGSTKMLEKNSNLHYKTIIQIQHSLLIFYPSH